MNPIHESDVEQMEREFSSDAIKEVRRSSTGLENQLEAWTKKLDGTNEARYKHEVSVEMKNRQAALKESMERLQVLRDKLQMLAGGTDSLKESVDQTKKLQSDMSKNLAKHEESNSSLKKKFTKLIDYARSKIRKTERSKPDAESIAQHENLSEATFGALEDELSLIASQLGSLQRLAEALQASNELEVKRQRDLIVDLQNRRANINLDDLREKITEQEQKLAEVLERITLHEAKKSEVLKSDADVNAEITKRTNEVSMQEQKIAQLSKENSKLEVECGELLSKKELLQKEVNEFMSTANSKILVLEQEQQDLAMAKRNEMMERKEAMQQKVFEAQKHCYQLEEKLNKLKAQLLRQGVDPETTTVDMIRAKIAAT